MIFPSIYVSVLYNILIYMYLLLTNVLTYSWADFKRVFSSLFKKYKVDFEGVSLLFHKYPYIHPLLKRSAVVYNSYVYMAWKKIT